MKILWIFFVSFFSSHLMAQKEELKPTLIDNTDPTRWIYISPTNQPGLRGDRYLFDEWKRATLEFSENIKRENLLVNYNLEDEELEIFTTEGVKIVPKGFITSWQTEDRSFIFVAGSNFPCLMEHKIYMEVIWSGENIQLYKMEKVEKKNPTYNEKLGIGDNNYRYIHLQNYILTDGQVCLDISGSANKRKKIMNDFLRTKKLVGLIGDKNLNLKNESDLVLLVHQIDEHL